MKRFIGWMSAIGLTTLLAACTGTLELGVEPEASATEEQVAALQAEPTEEPVEAETTEEAPESETALTDGIVAALNARDEAALIDAMRDPFVIGYWRSEGLTLTPEEAVVQVFNALPEGATLEATTNRGAFPALDGMTPEAMFGPEVDVQSVVFTSGWGETGEGEAFLLVATDDAGASTWYGMILAPIGFDDVASSPSIGIVAALNARNRDALTAQMADPFAFGFWRTEWQSLSPEEALVPIMDQLPDGARLTATTDQTAFPALDGQPVETMLGPDVPLEQVIFVTGWGAEGQGGALLFMARSESGTSVWQAMLFAQDGFE